MFFQQKEQGFQGVIEQNPIQKKVNWKNDLGEVSFEVTSSYMMKFQIVAPTFKLNCEDIAHAYVANSGFIDS